MNRTLSVLAVMAVMSTSACERGEHPLSGGERIGRFSLSANPASRVGDVYEMTAWRLDSQTGAVMFCEAWVAAKPGAANTPGPRCIAVAAQAVLKYNPATGKIEPESQVPSPGWGKATIVPSPSAPSTGSVPKRLPGETIDQYLSRTK
jgi:hypothetical protein